MISRQEQPARPASHSLLFMDLENRMNILRFPSLRPLLVLSGIILAALSGFLRAQTPPDSAQSTLRLIPTPQSIAPGRGQFSITHDIKIVAEGVKDTDDQFAATQLVDEIRAEFGLNIAVAKNPRGKSVLLGQPARDKALRNELKASKLLLPANLGKEGYLLHIAPTKILIAANTSAGVFYGVQTLKQLIRSNRQGSAIPCMTIVDRPALQYRGWMDDISRGPIPTMVYLKDVIKTMSEYKQNFFTLYTEHVFRLKSHPDIAPADGLTTEEVAELTAFARKYHVELIGNAQSFGHMEHMLRSPFYNRIKENASVVTPAVEETYQFLKQAYDEIVASYKSPLFHINSDEVYGLGAGPARRMVDSLGMPGVYAYHINRINDLIKPHGKRILMWGDIAAQNPEIIPKLPKDLVVISWGYHPAESFEAAIIPFKNTGFDFMVAPGVSCWNEVWPNMSVAVVNISNYVRDGAKLGTLGMMNTAWDDDGENFFNYNWHGLLWGAECSWRPPLPLSGDDAVREREQRLTRFNHSFDNLFYGISDVALTLFRFDSLRSIPVRSILRDAGVWSPMLSFDPKDVNDEALANNDRVVEGAKELIARLTAFLHQVKRNAHTLDYALFAANRALFTGRKNLIRAALSHAMQSRDPDEISSVRGALTLLLDQLHALKAEYVRLWNRENRGWWLDRILEKYDRLGYQLLDLDKTVIVEPLTTSPDGRRYVSLRTAFEDQAIHFSIDGSEPTLRSPRYTAPIEIYRPSLLCARVFVDRQAYPMAERFLLVHKGLGCLFRLNSRYSQYNPAYAAGGELGLLDGLRGSENFADGRWQGYQGQDLDIIIDLRRLTSVKSVTVGFLQNSLSWILMPERLQIWTSKDSTNFTLAREVVNTVGPREEGVVVRDLSAAFTNLSTRFIRIVARNPGKLPSWHQSAGSESYIFADEIVVE